MDYIQEDRRRWAAWSTPSSEAIRNAKSRRAPTATSARWRADEKIVVGVNKLRERPALREIPLLRIDESVQREQMDGLAKVKAGRSAADVAQALEAIRHAAKGGGNLMPPIIGAARVYATEQEICDVLRDVFGQHTDQPEF
jgi:methylmalonyl-CoA mutase N-terminal domain/subunit